MDRISDAIANCVSYFILILMFLVSFEVAMRYLFNHPTIWSTETTQYLFLTMIALGGAYVMRANAHVNVDIIHCRLRPRARAIVNLFTYLVIFFYLGFVVWKTWYVAVRSYEWRETSASLFGPPIWPIKFFIPVGAFLLLLQTVATYFRNIMQAISGEEDTELIENREDEA